MPFLVPIFANNMAIYFDDKSPNFKGIKGPTDTAKAWSESVKLASPSIFPPSITIAAAEAAMFTVLASWSYQSDSAGSTLKSAIDAFYATYAPGCLPSFAAVPPTQCPIESTFAAGMAGIPHTMWAVNCGNVIANWINTGTWVSTPAGPGGAGPWL